MSRKEIKGSMTALITPFLEDASVDEKSLRRLIDLQIEAGTDGLVPCGTTGESATLDHEEHQRVIQITIEQTAGRVPVIAGTGSNSTREAIALTKEAEKSGADAALVITPYYNKPSQQGLYEHFQDLAKSTSLPVILYNVPSRTGVNMLPETVARLSKIENIIGIKEAAGSMPQVQKLIRDTQEGFIVLSGEDAINFPCLTLGGMGSISVLANVVPEVCAQMHDAFFSGNWEVARSIHLRFLALTDALFLETNPVPVKTAMSWLHNFPLYFRRPLCPLLKENEEKLKNVMKDLELL